MFHRTTDTTDPTARALDVALCAYLRGGAAAALRVADDYDLSRDRTLASVVPAADWIALHGDNPTEWECDPAAYWALIECDANGRLWEAASCVA